MPHHGFTRSRRWRAEKTTLVDGGAHAHASFESSSKDHAYYPFNYRLETAVSVSDSLMTHTMRVAAARDNDQPMPFTIGQHFTLDLTSWWGENWLQGTLSGAGRSGWKLDGLTLAEDSLELPAQPVALTDSVLGDVLIPAVPDKALRITSPDGTKYIDLSFTVSSLPSEEAALWVMHRDREGRFFCLEPWVGWPNGLSSGRGRIELEPGKEWNMSFQVNIMSISHADVAVPGVVHINPAIVDSTPRRAGQSVKKNDRVMEDS